MALKFSYYPGCSVKGVNTQYEDSLLKVFSRLNIQLEEIPEWNCCGATAYMSIDEIKAFTLSFRNLALAKKMGYDVVVPCPACYLNLNKSQIYASQKPALRAKIEQSLRKVGYEMGNGVVVRHPIDVLLNDVGLDEIKKHIKRPLKNLRIACYYGCQVVRPFSFFDDQINPTTLERLMEVTGGEVVDYPIKTRCCGGSLTGTIPEVGLRLVYILLHEARRRGADVIVTICPLCQFNMDAYYPKLWKKYEKIEIPVIYFSQLLGYAMGFSYEEVGLNKNFLDFRKVLKQRGFES